MPFSFGQKAAQNLCGKELSRYRNHQVRGKRVSVRPSGSLTLEAAVILPLFLMLLIGIWCFFQILLFQTQLQHAMDSAAQKASAYYGAAQQFRTDDGETADSLGMIGKEILSCVVTNGYLKAEIRQNLGDAGNQRWLENGTEGLYPVLLGAPEETGMIDFIVSYRIKMPFIPGTVGTLQTAQRSRRAIWSGTLRWRKAEDPEQEKLVYITEHGSVYHTSLECRYLHLKIRTIWANELREARNQAGRSYTPCERCGKQLTAYCYYVTESGERYHTKMTCPALTRNIRTVPLKEVSLPPCSSCGQKEE